MQTACPAYDGSVITSRYPVMDVLKTISLITSLVEPMLVPSNTVPSSSIKYAFMTPPFLMCSFRCLIRAYLSQPKFSLFYHAVRDFSTGFLKFFKKLVTVQPLHLLVFIFMKTRSLVVPPYADLDEKVLMQASLQHTFSFKPAHG